MHRRSTFRKIRDRHTYYELSCIQEENKDDVDDETIEKGWGWGVGDGLLIMRSSAYFVKLCELLHQQPDLGTSWWEDDKVTGESPVNLWTNTSSWIPPHNTHTEEVCFVAQFTQLTNLQYVNSLKNRCFSVGVCVQLRAQVSPTHHLFISKRYSKTRGWRNLCSCVTPLKESHTAAFRNSSFATAKDNVIPGLSCLVFKNAFVKVWGDALVIQALTSIKGINKWDTDKWSWKELVRLWRFTGVQNERKNKTSKDTKKKYNNNIQL